jgi:hypothetical protein
MISKPLSVLTAPGRTRQRVPHATDLALDASTATKKTARHVIGAAILGALMLPFTISGRTEAWAQERAWPSNFSAKSAVCDAEEHAVEVMLTYRKLGTEAAHKLLGDYAKQKNDKGEPRCSTVQAHFVVIREVLHAPGISVRGRTADGYVLYVHLGSQVSPDFYVYTKRGYLLLLRPPAREHMA